MSVEIQDLPDLLPEFYFARAASDPYYKDIYILIVDPGDTENDILKKLATKLGAGGLRGVALFILPVDHADDDEKNNPGGPLKMNVVFQVWENRQINTSATGTQKNGYAVARYTYNLFKHYSVRGLCKLLVPDSPAIQRVVPPAGMEKKLRGWGISFTGREDIATQVAKVGLPVFTPGAAATVTIACPTAGAEIYFTLDGTPAAKTNPAAQLYAGPINIPAEGCTLFAGAFLDGSFPSDTISSTFTN